MKTSHCYASMCVSHGALMSPDWRRESVSIREVAQILPKLNWCRFDLKVDSSFTSRRVSLSKCQSGYWNHETHVALPATRSLASLFSGIAQTYVNLIEVQTMAFCGSVNKRLSWFIIQFESREHVRCFFPTTHRTLHNKSNLKDFFFAYRLTGLKWLRLYYFSFNFFDEIPFSV